MTGFPRYDRDVDPARTALKTLIAIFFISVGLLVFGGCSHSRVAEHPSTQAGSSFVSPTATGLLNPIVGPRLSSSSEIGTSKFELAVDGSEFLRPLRVIPDSTNTRSIAWIDNFDQSYWAVAKAMGESRPGPNAPVDWLPSFQRPIALTSQAMQLHASAKLAPPEFVHAPTFCCPNAYLATYRIYPYVGFDLRDVDETVVAGSLSGARDLQAAFGNFDPSRTREALDACGQCEPADLKQHRGRTYYSWGEDFKTDLRRRFAPPLYDSVGHSGRLYVGERFALYAHSDGGIEGMMDAQGRSTTTLADLPDYQLAARALVGLGAYDAGFSDSGRSLSDMEKALCRDKAPCNAFNAWLRQVQSAPLLKPFSVVAAGFALKDPQDLFGGVNVALVLVCPDAKTATADAELLQTRLRMQETARATSTVSPPDSWGASVENTRITADGRVVLAELDLPLDAREFHLVDQILAPTSNVLVYR